MIRACASLFITVPVSTYYLGPKDFGIVGIITVFSALIVPLSAIGTGWVIGANYYKLKQQEQGELIFNTLLVEVLIRSLWIFIFAGAGIFLLPVLIKSYEKSFLLYFWIFLLAEWLNGVWEIVSYTIVLQKKSRTYAFLEITQILSGVIFLIVCLVVLHLKTISLVLANLGNSLAGFLFSLIYIRKYIVRKIRKKWINEALRLSLPLVPVNLMNIVSNSIDRFFIERWLGLSQLGIYTHSLSYKNMFMMSTRAFSKTSSPEMLEGMSCNDNSKLDYTRAFLKKWFGFLTIAGTAVALFSKEAVAFLTHGKFTAAAPLVSLWFMILLIYSFGIPYNQFLFIHKKIKFVLASEVILGFVSWLFIALAIKFFGLKGAVVSVLLYFLFLYLIRKGYAMHLGCVDFEGIYFWASLALIYVLIILNISSLAFYIRILIYFLLSITVLLVFGLFNIRSFAKNIWKCSNW
ncbi:MAG: oligosaccharide flippase family protein [Candidatus Omnitrophota bacterium]